MGIKHNPQAKIYKFKQKDHETIRDFVNRLKQYIARCPVGKKRSESKIISLFLEGLKNKMLYKHLYAKKHHSFNVCYIEAMDLDDNFDENDEITSEIARPKG